MITLRDLELRRGTKLLFQDVNLSFFTKQKIGIVGRNGSGKSSLLALILNELSPDHGSIELSKNLRLAYIKQEIPSSAQLCIDYVIDADTELRAIERQLKEAQIKNDGELIGALFSQYEQLDGYSAKARAAALLDGLGFSQTQQHRSVDTLSGGWRMQLNLARALFCRSEVLLLDEPTNHLDLDTVIWLEQFLNKYSGLLLLISHDRDFLDNIVTHIAYLTHKTIKVYIGNYSAFEKQYAEQLLLQQKTFEKQQQQIQHWHQFIDRFRAKASKAKQVQSRIKALERIQTVTPLNSENDFSFTFLKPRSLPHTLLELIDVDFSYNEQPVFNGLNLKIINDCRVGILGRNGAGKSTLIKLLAGEIEIQKGSVVPNNHLKIAYFAQHQLDQLDGKSNALQHLEQINQTNNISATVKNLRTFLGGFGFSGEMVLQKVATFSGGEKARLVLALLVWQRPNLLLLDEPTNHLDFTMRQALIVALQEYQGALIIVSHDRFLLRSTIDQFYLVANQTVQSFAGDLEDYQQWLLRGQNSEQNTKKSHKIKYSDKSINNRQKLFKIEKELHKLHEQESDLKEILANQEIYNADKIEILQRYLNQYQKLEQKIQTLENEWLELQDRS